MFHIVMHITTIYSLYWDNIGNDVAYIDFQTMLLVVMMSYNWYPYSEKKWKTIMYCVVHFLSCHTHFFMKKSSGVYHKFVK